MIRDSFFGRHRINPSQELDEKTLTAIAEQTGGLYFRARDTGQLSVIYQRLDELEPVEVDQQTFRPVRSLYMWPLGASLVLGLMIVASGLFKRAGA